MDWTKSEECKFPKRKKHKEKKHKKEHKRHKMHSSERLKTFESFKLKNEWIELSALMSMSQIASKRSTLPSILTDPTLVVSRKSIINSCFNNNSKLHPTTMKRRKRRTWPDCSILRGQRRSRREAHFCWPRRSCSCPIVPSGELTIKICCKSICLLHWRTELWATGAAKRWIHNFTFQ